MSPKDKEKVVATAQKFVQKGQFDKAIQEYVKIVRDEPVDVRTWLKIGDLFAKRGQLQDATQTYLKVAEIYSQQGFYLKAVAVYKQILKLDPGLFQVNLKLADLYQQLGLLSDALAQYDVVANLLVRSGEVRQALDVRKRMVELDPENVAARISLAEMFSREGLTAEAAEEFAIASAALKEQQRMEDYVKVAERLLWHRPDDIATARELAKLYLKRDDAKRGLAKLQICFKADPRNVETLELLAVAFHALGQIPKTVSVYKEIARIYGEQNRQRERMELYRRVLEIAPDDTDARDALRGGGSAAPPATARSKSRPPVEISVEPDEIEEAEAIEDAVEADEEVLEVDEDSQPGAAAARPRSAAPSGAGGRRGGEVERILTETEVYIKYGLRDKAIDHLQLVLEMDPEHVDAREKLKDLFLESRQPALAIEHLAHLARQFAQGDADRAVGYLHEILGLDANHRAAKEMLRSLGASERAPAGRSAVPMREPEPFEGDESLLPPALHGDGERARGGLLKEVSLDLDDEPAPEVRSRPPGDNVIPFPGGREIGPSDVEEALEEAEFFVTQGLHDEAREIIETLTTRFPNNPLVQDKVAELREMLANAEGGGVAADEGIDGTDQLSLGDDSFDLGRELAEELSEVGPPPADEGQQQIDVETVLAQFKRGIEQVVSPEDSATHYDLGIAYKEMGLLDEAANEFRTALKDPKRACIGHTMVGLCLLEQGEVGEAIAEFKKGLYVEQKAEREELGLYYELGAAYEISGDVKEALYYFQKVQKRDPDFRQVREKLQALSGPRPAGAKRPNLGLDEIGNAFDDLAGSTRKG